MFKNAKFNNKGWCYRSVGVASVLFIIVVIFTFSSSKSPEVQQKDNHPNQFYEVSDVQLPAAVDFAGEKLPLNLFDVSEALEREMLVNTYWHSQTFLLIKRAKRYFQEIEPILKQNNIPDDFKYMALAESGLTNSSSPAGAVGFWQFVQTTAQDYGLEVNKEVDERYNVEKSTNAMCRFMRDSYDLFKSWTMAAASYNCGRRGLGKQIERQYSTNYYDLLLNEETARYIYRIVSLKLIIGNPQKYGFNLNDSDSYQPVPYTTVKISGPVKDWALFAFDNGTNYKILKFLNPWLRESFLTNLGKKTYIIKIPAKGYRPHFKELTKTETDSLVLKSDEMPQ